MIYLELEKEQQQKSGKRIQGYAEKIETMKERKEKEEEVNVEAQNICRGRNQRD